ncbi:c-type cytochrome domain-containing protein [Pseudomonas sp.]|uniref:c-type cytochrome domain-containing protein n=1 Tax=Pseudomonas sp. TaxID=306 RepID=UPI003A985D0B
MPWLALRLLTPLLLSASVLAAASPTYHGDIAALLANRCLVCHSGAQAPLGLRLDSLENLLRGSQRGPVVHAGDAAGSELLRRLTGSSQPRMPLSGPPFLDAAEIAMVERWINAGLPAGKAIATRPAAPLPPPDEAIDYRHVEAILLRRCATCHSASGLMGAAPEGYLLSSYAATLASDERARVVPGNPAASELVRRIRGQARPRMPYDGPPYLTDAEIDLIVVWIEQGARDAAGQPAPVPVGARVRLHGRLDDDGKLDGLALLIDARTRLDDAPRPGAYVQVRGRLDASGRVRAERLRLR